MARIAPGHDAESRIPEVPRIRTDADFLPLFLRVSVVSKMYIAVVNAFLAKACTPRIENLTLRGSCCNVPSSYVTIIKQ
jgi:hypothetical protein